MMNSISLYPNAIDDKRIRKFLPVKRIVCMSKGELAPENEEIMISNDIIQAYVHPEPELCRLKPGASIVLDFGIELNGGIRIVTGKNELRTSNIRVCFGESVSEAMKKPNNDHAMHETTIELAPMAHNEIGNTGFRFVRLEIPGEANSILEIINVVAVAVYRDLPYVGSFQSNDELLNQIWKTGAYTVHLNMQDFLYDGIKRDRLVWMGDMHPEIRVISSVFDDNDVVESSLDYLRCNTELPAFMNGINSYSLWWIISLHDWHMYRGNLGFLKRQQAYLKQLLHLFVKYLSKEGIEKLPEWRFLDWASVGNDVAIHVGMQGLMAWAFDAGKELSINLNDKHTANLCSETLLKLKSHNPDGGMSKQANALKVLGAIANAQETNKTVLSQEPFSGLSPFGGYYAIQARALAGDYTGALEVIRHYWGGMIKLGATTFWEHFDLEWAINSSRIDEIPNPDKADIHADFGEHCYKGLRHSLCHGWSGGPTAWISEHLLGVIPLKPGFKTVRVKPRLTGLDWLEGSMPTPFGPIFVSAEKLSNGKIKFDLKKPKEIIVCS